MATAGFEQRSVRLLDVTTGRELARLERHRGTSWPWRSPDGRRLSTGSYDRTVLTWDVAARGG
jgi:WD40 repeat protein